MKEWLYWALSYTFRGFIVVTIGCTLLHNYQTVQRLFQNWQQPAGKHGFSLDNVMWADACDLSRSKCVKDVLVVRGGIGLHTYFYLNRLYKQKTVQTICFDSPCGMVVMMFAIARWISNNNLNTCVAELYKLHDFPLELVRTNCLSACPLILASGRKRWSVGESTIIGVHQGGADISWCFCDLTISANSIVTGLASLMPPTTANIGLLFEISDKASPNEMLRLTRADLQKVNMFTEWL